MIPSFSNFRVVFYLTDADYVICRKFFGIWLPVAKKKLVQSPFDRGYMSKEFYTHRDRILQCILKSTQCKSLTEHTYAY